MPVAEQQHIENNSQPAEQADIPLPVEQGELPQTAVDSNTSELSDRLEKAFDGLLGGNSVGSFEKKTKKKGLL